MKLFTLIIMALTSTAMAQHGHIYEKDFLKKNKLSAAVTEEVTINASRAKVWEVISNWGDAYLYTPGLDKSYCTTDEKTGMESKRHCDIGKGFVNEEVLVWEEGSRFVQQVYEMGNIPMMKKIVVELEVRKISSNQSKLIYTMAYKMPMGKLLKGSIQKSIKTNALSTKHYIETGDGPTAKDPEKIKELYF